MAELLDHDPCDIRRHSRSLRVTPATNNVAPGRNGHVPASTVQLYAPWRGSVRPNGDVGVRFNVIRMLFNRETYSYPTMDCFQFWQNEPNYLAISMRLANLYGSPLLSPSGSCPGRPLPAAAGISLGANSFAAAAKRPL
jgi:hypothetical protein